MDVTLNVPVRRFVLKYITSNFGHPWVLSSKYKEGRMMQALLERAPDRYEKFQSNEAVLQITVPSRIVCLKGCYLSQQSINEFIEYIHSVILDEIVTYHDMTRSGIGFKNCERVNVTVPIDNKTSRIRKIPKDEGVRFFSQKETILHIREKYNIGEDDLTYDSIVKHVQRNSRNKIKADY